MPSDFYYCKEGGGAYLVKGTLFDSLYPKLATIVGPVVTFDLAYPIVLAGAWYISYY
jgi:hypothetical protein